MNILIKNVISNLNGLPPLSDGEIEQISNYFEYEKVRRKRTVLDLDESSDHVYYVISGCLRLFNKDEKSDEYTLYFGPQDYWVADFDGFINQKSTNMMIDSIVDTEYLRLSFKKRSELFKKFPAMETYFRELLERNAAFMQNKQILDKKHDARERYDDFCDIYPMLVGRVKDKHVASYIGVTPEFFSKMINSKQM